MLQFLDFGVGVAARTNPIKISYALSTKNGGVMPGIWKVSGKRSDKGYKRFQSGIEAFWKQVRSIFALTVKINKRR